jgi:hypothetical protein
VAPGLAQIFFLTLKVNIKPKTPKVLQIANRINKEREKEKIRPRYFTVVMVTFDFQLDGMEKHLGD